MNMLMILIKKQGKHYFKYIDKAILLNIVIKQLLSYNIVTFRVQNQMCYQPIKKY